MQIKIPNMDLGNITCTGSLKDKNQVCQIPWIANYIQGIYKYALGIAGILATVVMMFGGFLWLMSAGNPQMIGDAKNWITGAVTGLILLFTSYIILYTVNPELTILKPITLGTISQMEDTKLADANSNSTSQQYKNMPCPSSGELSTGVNFYATGYYKPAHNDNSLDTLCKISMQCDCTTWGSSKDNTPGINCDKLYGNSYPNWRPCKAFTVGSDYCNKNSSGVAPQLGTIAADWSCLPKNQTICANGKTYTVKDTGSGIKGRRIDIWTGDSLSQANAVTGVVTVKSGACN